MCSKSTLHFKQTNKITPLGVAELCVCARAGACTILSVGVGVCVHLYVCDCVCVLFLLDLAVPFMVTDVA